MEARAAPAAPIAEIVVLGSHPCCYFATALLAEAGVPVVHASIPDEAVPDHLVFINPKFFDLHKSLVGLKRQLELAPIYGLRFLSDSVGVASEHIGKSTVGFVGSYAQVRDQLVAVAERYKVPLLKTQHLDLHHLDEHGVELTVNAHRLHPKLLIVGGSLLEIQKKMLGLPESWDSDVPHRYTYLKLPDTDWLEFGAPGEAASAAGEHSAAPPGKPLMIMSLDLKGKLSWAWMMQGVHETQLAVEQPMTPDAQVAVPPRELLEYWATVATSHGVLKTNGRTIDFSAARTIEFPFAGALAQEGVANRALLIGPAGGFYTACGEDIYPNCWSAVFAADVAAKAVKERHLQDSLRAYREKWGSTLGDYLRGPQQNLRFLLPLVYRNPVMTARLSEAILSGASVVR